MQELIEELRSLAFTELHLGTGDIVLTQGHIAKLEKEKIAKMQAEIAHLQAKQTA